MTAQEDRVAAEVVSTGISTGIHLNGRPYTNHHHHHFPFTVRDGQIVAVNEYMDAKHLHDFIY